MDNLGELFIIVTVVSMVLYLGARVGIWLIDYFYNKKEIFKKVGFVRLNPR
jgi:hypothetical protein